MNAAATILENSDSSDIKINVDGDRADRGISGGRGSIILDPGDRDVIDTFCVGAGTPACVWHNRAVEIGVPGSADLDSVAEVLEGMRDDIARLFDLYEGSEWDGSNHVGSWSDTGERDAIMQSIRTAIDDNARCYWEASEWLAPAWYEVKKELRSKLESGKDRATALVEYVAECMSAAVGESILLEKDDLTETIDVALGEVEEEMGDEDE